MASLNVRVPLSKNIVCICFTNLRLHFGQNLAPCVSASLCLEPNSSLAFFSFSSEKLKFNFSAVGDRTHMQKKERQQNTAWIAVCTVHAVRIKRQTSQI